MPYIPASTKGSIIITSRRRDVEVPGSLRISVEPLDPQSGASLLNSIVSYGEVDDLLTEISKLLGGLPLAIVTAGGFIAMNEISPSDYLQLLEHKNEFQLPGASRVTAWEYEQSLQSVFDHTLVSLSSDARNLVDCMSFLNPDDIPEELFLQKRKHPFLSHVDSSFQELLSQCLIRRNGPTYTINIQYPSNSEVGSPTQTPFRSRKIPESLLSNLRLDSGSCLAKCG